jgi:hypothetical protein
MSTRIGPPCPADPQPSGEALPRALQLAPRALLERSIGAVVAGVDAWIATGDRREPAVTVAEHILEVGGVPPQAELRRTRPRHR